MMTSIISLDYDNTYTRDPEMWLEFVKDAQKRGHKVYCITYRYEHECIDMDSRLTQLVEVIPTGRRAKRSFARTMLIQVDIWIDDQPDYIVSGDL